MCTLCKEKNGMGLVKFGMGLKLGISVAKSERSVAKLGMGMAKLKLGVAKIGIGANKWRKCVAKLGMGLALLKRVCLNWEWVWLNWEWL